MKYIVLPLISTLLFAARLSAEVPITIEIGKNYERYTEKELKERVWNLERAVAQLQNQVFQLAINKGGSATEVATWTCQMQSFATTHIASASTKSSAMAQVLKKCSEASNAIHCRDSDVKCGKD
jgi:hypothetical protein